MPFLVNKPTGKTPLEAVEKLKAKNSKLKNKNIAYAGRLDPMARGLLLLIVEPETKVRHKYQDLDKTYEFEILIGISTDTYDLLGLPKLDKKILSPSHNDISRTIINKFLQDYVGKRKQPYPPYSSKTVKGKPLFWYARKSKLNSIKIPTKEVEIFDIQLLKLTELKTKDLRKKIQIINNIKGDFRQKKIVEAWENILDNHPDISYQLARVKVHSSSGTYVRQITHELGRVLKVKTVTFSIKRTKVGKYNLEDAIEVF